MKKIFTILAIFMALGVSAQNAFFPTKKGMALVTAQKNAKSSVTGYNKLTIKDVQSGSGITTINYEVEILDKNQKSSKDQTPYPCKVTIQNNVVTMDLNEMMSRFKNSSMGDMKFEISGIPLQISSNMKPGDVLKDADVTMSVDMGLAKMKTVITMTDGKCVDIEDVTVAAGTFKCHKVTQTVTTSVLGKKITSKVVSWYAIGIGAVKTESYDKNDKLQSSSELMSVS